jgi:hypothetical protein
MSTIKVIDGDGVAKYYGNVGTGTTTGDPYHSIPADFYTEVSKGNVYKHSIVHKFGHNTSVGTSFIPVSHGGVYQTIQTGSATTLRIKAGGDANDTAARTGAREVTLIGLDETGAEVTETLATAGASASSVTTATFIRLYRCFVSESGTYATSSTGSHSADIVIENGSGGTDWGTIKVNGFAKSQSEIGAYTIPNGYTGYLLGAFGFVDSTKVTELLFFKREGILQTSAPYDSMRLIFEERVESSGVFEIDLKAPIKLNEDSNGCDVGFLSKVNTGTADVEVDFELLLVQD